MLHRYIELLEEETIQLEHDDEKKELVIFVFSSNEERERGNRYHTHWHTYDHKEVFEEYIDQWLFKSMNWIYRKRTMREMDFCKNHENMFERRTLLFIWRQIEKHQVNISTKEYLKLRYEEDRNEVRIEDSNELNEYHLSILDIIVLTLIVEDFHNSMIDQDIVRTNPSIVD